MLAMIEPTCQKIPHMSDATVIQQETYGQLPDGKEVTLFTLTNSHGTIARVMNYGAILVSLETADSSGQLADLTHGYDTLDGWLHNDHYLGATVGRYGNRIADGKFSLDGKDYTLATNNDPGGIPCALHGGIQGFDKKLWDYAVTDSGVTFTCTSNDGEEGYPGNLTAKVSYSLNENNELTWEASATTDAATVINLIHHSYWNLSGDSTTPITDHLLTLNAPRYLPTTPGMIPLGELSTVKGTPMDFTTPQMIGDRIDDDFEALQLGEGYDHCWVLPENEGVQLAARAEDPKSGRVMEIHTDQPGIQFYTANFLNPSVVGKNNTPYQRRTALCLETQNFPDAPNQPDFPSCVLRPNETYKHTLIHKFSTQ